MPRLDQFANALSRPLFLRSRRPPAKPQQASPVSDKDTTPTFVLRGTVLSGSTHLALVERADGVFVRAAVGHEIEGWRVTEVFRDSVTFQKGPLVREINLKDAVENTLPSRQQNTQQRRQP